jgi:hypothetical protein
MSSLFPNAKSNPAAGKIATGSINAFPIRCKTPKKFLNMQNYLLCFSYFALFSRKKA